ncbi:hypothetical protein [Thermomonas sp.]|uniref:hypothetical protein n=1 Tax=Thermomonas sp. TaxID=1971895 RepID=UPI00260909A6|nr:hypothetical protein [Thermomonas sp.]
MSLDLAVRARIETLLAANPSSCSRRQPARAAMRLLSKAIGALDAIRRRLHPRRRWPTPRSAKASRPTGERPTIPAALHRRRTGRRSDIILQMVGSGELHAALGFRRRRTARRR